jgi:glycosyltransferase involved in cell wall biosynthesis
VTFAGNVSGDDLVALYADARGVVYTPYDEDFGYVTLEAFLSGKPVITATDSGGTLEFVTSGDNGFVCEPSPDAIADAMATLADDERLARRLGEAGRQRARLITWDGVVEQLLG